MLTTAFCVLIAYALGANPFGAWIAQARAGVELRRIGSGGIGATNVFRALGWKWAVLVFVLDAAKGAAPVILAGGLGLSPAGRMACGLIAAFAHVFNPYLAGRGGKGVATAFGAMLMLAPGAALATLGAWAAVMLAVRIVSLGSLVAAAALPVFTGLFVSGPAWTPYVVGALALSLLVGFAHRENIGRLLRGEEPPIAGRRAEPDGGGDAI